MEVTLFRAHSDNGHGEFFGDETAATDFLGQSQFKHAQIDQWEGFLNKGSALSLLRRVPGAFWTVTLVSTHRMGGLFLRSWEYLTVDTNHRETQGSDSMTFPHVDEARKRVAKALPDDSYLQSIFTDILEEDFPEFNMKERDAMCAEIVAALYPVLRDNLNIAVQNVLHARAEQKPTALSR